MTETKHLTFSTSACTSQNVQILSSYSKKYKRISLYTTTYMNTVSVQTAQHAHFYTATATLVGSAIAGSSGLPSSIRQSSSS